MQGLCLPLISLRTLQKKKYLWPKCPELAVPAFIPLPPPEDSQVVLFSEVHKKSFTQAGKEVKHFL